MSKTSLISAQNELTLEETVDIAQNESPYFHMAANRYEQSYWQYKNFKSSFKPQLRLSATIPTFYRLITPVTQPDGRIEYVRVTQANNSLGVSIAQNIGLTGGSITATSSLQRTDNLSGIQSNYFLATPLSISYRQSSVFYNEFRWQKRIEPMLFDGAKKKYVREIELAALDAATLYFSCLEVQSLIDISKTNVANSDTLLSLSRQRYAIGTLSNTDLLQLELNLIRYKSELSNYALTYKKSLSDLKRNLSIKSDTILFIKPNSPLVKRISHEVALMKAKLNRETLTEIEIEKVTADKEIEIAKTQNNIQFNLYGNFGTQQTASKLGDSYRQLKSQQSIGVSFDVPILDWGFRRSQIRLAKANRELIEITSEQQALNFEQEIHLAVTQFNERPAQLQLTQRADTIAAERLKIARDRYLLGKLTITELNYAMQESIGAKISYIRALKDYWLSLYLVRSLTLYDFVRNQDIEYKYKESYK